MCRNHGGKSPQALAAADARLAEREAVLASKTFGFPIEVDPHTALLQELHRTAGVVEWLGQMVQTLDADAVAWGTTRITVGGPDHGRTSEAGRNVWVSLWQDERKHLTAVAAACAKAGIEERRVLLAESQGRVLAGVVQRILTGMYEALVHALGEHGAAHAVLERVWPEAIGVIVPTELRAVSATGAEGGEAT